MKIPLFLLTLLSICVSPALGLAPLVVQDYEKDSSLPKLWVVGIPNENATVGLSMEHPHDGKRCMELHYHFTGGGQYLGGLKPS